MALNYVQLTVDLFDGSGDLFTQGVVSFAPSSTLTDSTNGQFITQAPIQAAFTPGSAPKVKLLATDNGTLSPGVWNWVVTFTDVPGNPASFSFHLPFASGASQNLSGQTHL